MTSSENIAKNLEQNKQKVHKKDYAFYNIDFVAKLAKACEKECCQCERCQASLKRLERLSLEYPGLIEEGAQGRATIEDGMDEIMAHLKSEHGYAKAGWYKPLYGICGLAAGMAAGALAALIVPDGSRRAAFLLASMVMLVAGYWMGSRKDFGFEKEGKAL